MEKAADAGVLMFGFSSNFLHIFCVLIFHTQSFVSAIFFAFSISGGMGELGGGGTSQLGGF